MNKQLLADKILLLTLDFPPKIGGVACYYHGLCNALKNKIVVLTVKASLARRTTRNLDITTQKGFIVYRCKLESEKRIFGFLPRWLPSIYNTFKIVKKEKISLLAVGNILPLGYVAYLIKIFKKKPYTVFTHGYDIMLAACSVWKKFWAKFILKNACQIFANSQFTKAQIIKHYQIAENKIKIVYPGVAEELIKKAETTREAIQYPISANSISQFPNFPISQFHLLTVARLQARKGLDTAIESLPSVIKIISNLKYTIVGEGPDRSRLQTIVKQLNLASYVEFAGAKNQDELIEYYRQADIFILTPRQIGPDVEGFGIVYLEANLFGLPVIGSKTGGVPEAVLDNQTGLLVKPQNSKELAKAIIRLYQNANWRRQLGRQGRERVLGEFRWVLYDIQEFFMEALFF